MISEKDISTIVNIASRYNVGRILMFGSSAGSQQESNDIDLAVEDIEPAHFFNFYGDLLFSLSKPVDLIDLKYDTKFNKIVRREGIRLYGRSV